ncbi:16430_t:CDS:2, partial [Funneliformis caledonium]
MSAIIFPRRLFRYYSFNNNKYFNKFNKLSSSLILNKNYNKYGFMNRFMHGLADKDLSAQLAEELTYYEKEKDLISTSTEIIDDVYDYKETSSIITKPTKVSLNQFNWE